MSLSLSGCPVSLCSVLVSFCFPCSGVSNVAGDEPLQKKELVNVYRYMYCLCYEGFIQQFSEKASDPNWEKNDQLYVEIGKNY